MPLPVEGAAKFFNIALPLGSLNENLVNLRCTDEMENISREVSKNRVCRWHVVQWIALIQNAIIDYGANVTVESK